MMTSKTWASRPAKRSIDQGFNQVMKPWLKTKNRTLNVFSLPAANWEWERSLIECSPKTSFNFFGLERDPGVFEQMENTATELDEEFEETCSFFPMSGEYASFLEDYHEAQHTPEATRFDIVYLDFMGPWGIDKLQMIEKTAKYGLCAENSWLRVTLSGNRGWDSCWKDWAHDHTISNYRVTDTRIINCKPVANWRLYGVPRIIEACWAPTPYRVQPVNCGIYHSQSLNGTKAVSVQLSYLFKISH